MARRINRLTDLIARLLGKEWDLRAEESRAARDGGAPRPSTGASGESGTGTPGPSSSGRSPSRGRDTGSSSRVQRPSGPGARAGSSADSAGDHSGDLLPVSPWEPNDDVAQSGPRSSLRGSLRQTTSDLTLPRIESMLTGPMDYSVQLTDDRDHPCLLGTWDSFPFVIEIPEGHEGWLLVSGDWEEPAPVSQRDEIAASVNDWNRDKFFPTVGIIDSAAGPLVRATYLVDLSAGVTDHQLRLHLDTALSSCTQALSLVGPLLPEI